MHWFLVLNNSVCIENQKEKQNKWENNDKSDSISITVQSVSFSSKWFQLAIGMKNRSTKLTFVGFLGVRHIFLHFPILFRPFYRPHQTTISIRACRQQPFEHHPNFVEIKWNRFGDGTFNESKSNCKCTKIESSLKCLIDNNN